MLFRYWIAFTALYLLVLLTIGGIRVADQFEQISDKAATLAGDAYGYPVPCGKVRGTEGTNWIHRETTFFRLSYCWYTLKTIKANFPEYLSDGSSPEQLWLTSYYNARYDIPRPAPWLTMKFLAGWAMGLPLFILLVGSITYWFTKRAMSIFQIKPKPPTS